MSETVMLVLIGTVALIGGVVAVVKREAVARLNEKGIRTMYGKNPAADASTPEMMAFVGSMAAVIGVIMIIGGVLGVF